MYTISRQLAKAVFNIGDFFYKDNPTESVQIENGVITYTVGKSSFDKPIDSFFFSCKDWALEQNLYITSNNFIAEVRPIENGMQLSKLLYYVDIVDDIENWDLTAHSVAQNEQQSVFDACQWILDTKGV